MPGKSEKSYPVFSLQLSLFLASGWVNLSLDGDGDLLVGLVPRAVSVLVDAIRGDVPEMQEIQALRAVATGLQLGLSSGNWCYAVIF